VNTKHSFDLSSHHRDNLERVHLALISSPIAEWIGVLNRIAPLLKAIVLADLRYKHDKVLKSMVRNYKAAQFFDKVMEDHKLELGKLDVLFTLLIHRLLVPPNSIGADPEKREQLKRAFASELTNPKYATPTIKELSKPEDIIMVFVQLFNPFIEWHTHLGELRSCNFILAKENLIKLLYNKGVHNLEADGYLLNLALRQPGKLLDLLLEE
jgi:hypothetical protein